MLAQHLRQRYGITVDRFNSILESQGGVCLICREPETGRQHNRKRLSVDHCHKTGKIRGLLCGRCNRAIGLFKDSPMLVRAASIYLEVCS